MCVWVCVYRLYSAWYFSVGLSCCLSSSLFAISLSRSLVPSLPPFLPFSLAPPPLYQVLMESRHPCVEAMEDMAFIPNDVVLRRKERWKFLRICSMWYEILTRLLSSKTGMQNDHHTHFFFVSWKCSTAIFRLSLVPIWVAKVPISARYNFSNPTI